MPKTEDVIAVVGEWVQKADNDLKNAAHTLKLKDDARPTRSGYHAQQCVEKYVKALLVFHGVDFPKTHDLGVLIGLLPLRDPLPLTADEQDLFTEYATGARYPGWGDIPLADARSAVRLARRVRKQARQLLSRKSRRLGSQLALRNNS